MSGYGRTGYGATAGYLWLPRSPRQGQRGVVLLGGAGWNALNYVPTIPGAAGTYTGNLGTGTLASALAHAGITLICPNAGGGTTWGNDTVAAAGGVIDLAATAMQAAASWLATDKILTLGISGGAVAQARYMAAQPDECAGAVMILPLVDLNIFYSTNQGGLQSQIAAAYGVTAPAALPASADPTANAADVAESGPILLLTSDAASNTVPGLRESDCDTFTAAVNAADDGSCTQVICDSTNGHSDLTTAAVDIPTVAQFLIANGA